MISVLVTRPQSASENLADELQRQGYRPVLEPLLTIVPTEAPSPDLENIQAVMITSQNALTILNAESVGSLLQYPCFCVGPRTANKARAFGFDHVYSSETDGTALARLMKTILPEKKKTILHIGTQDSDSAAQDELQKDGFTVSLWPVYHAVPTTEFTELTIQLFEKKKLNTVLVFSARTAEILKILLTQYGLNTCCQNMIAIGLSKAVCDMLGSLPWQKNIAAAVPTEDAVIALLKETFPVS